MQELLEAVPDVDAQLALEPEELGATLLFVLRKAQQTKQELLHFQRLEAVQRQTGFGLPCRLDQKRDRMVGRRVTCDKGRYQTLPTEAARQRRKLFGPSARDLCLRVVAVPAHVSTRRITRATARDRSSGDVRKDGMRVTSFDWSLESRRQCSATIWMRAARQSG